MVRTIDPRLPPWRGPLETTVPMSEVEMTVEEIDEVDIEVG